MACLFCKIIAKELPTQTIHEDEHVVVVQDINPQAPMHLLILPKKHIATINDLQVEDQFLTSHMLLIAKKLAKQLGHDEQGYRIVINCNENGGQTVYHLHFHLLGGRPFVWPPG